MHKMGSPWPWNNSNQQQQQEVKALPPPTAIIPSIHNNNNNHHHHHHAGNKRQHGYGNGYGGGGGGGQYNNSPAGYYNNYQQNYQNQQHLPPHHLLPPGGQDQNQQQQQNLPPYPNHPHNNRFIPTSPMDGGGGEILPHRNKRPPPPPQQTYFTFEGIHNSNNNSYHPQRNNQFTPVQRKFSSSTSTSSSPSMSASSPTITTTTMSPVANPLSSHNSCVLEHSQFVNCVKGIPTWNRYYSDQKHRIIDFTDKNNSIRADPLINQLVSLCFVDTCITNLAVDAIVNSTTGDYAGIAGVDKMIHQQAGSSLREACKSLPRLGPGQAEMTLGFELPAKYVIHTNGPLTEGEAVEQLTGCYMSAFNLLLSNRLRTIAFPCISTGRKGLSKRFAADIALRAVRRFLEEQKHSVDRVILCLHHQKDIEIYLRYMQIYFPVEPPFMITT